MNIWALDRMGKGEFIMAEENKVDEQVTETQVTETQADTKPTFDDLLKDKAYQSEFDTRVTKALNTAKTKWEAQAETEKKKLIADTEAANKVALEKAIQEATAPLSEKIKNLMITAEVVKASAKDPKDIITQLNMEDIKLTDDTIEGLEEQIKNIKEKKPYLFNVEEAPKGKSGLDHNGGADNTDVARIRRAMGLK